MAYFTTGDGAQIYYEESGSGEPVVLVHGWAVTHEFFKFQTAELEKKYRVIALDLRGHGRSDRSEITEYNLTIGRLAQDIHELVEHLGLKQVTFMGWSMGVIVLYDYIRQYGCDNVRRMILIDMSPKTVNSEDWTYGQARNEVPAATMGWLNICVTDWKQAAEIFGPLMCENAQPRDPSLLEWALERTRNNVPHVMTSLVISMSAQDYRDLLPKITCPTLLAHGMNSVLYGKEHGEKIHSMFPASELAILPGGHMLMMEYPEEFNKAMMEFLERT